MQRQYDNEPPILALYHGRQPRLTPGEWWKLVAQGYVYFVFPGGAFLTLEGIDLAKDMEAEEAWIADHQEAAA